jgi:hypothetical protein
MLVLGCTSLRVTVPPINPIPIVTITWSGEGKVPGDEREEHEEECRHHATGAPAVAMPPPHPQQPCPRRCHRPNRWPLPPASSGAPTPPRRPPSSNHRLRWSTVAPDIPLSPPPPPSPATTTMHPPTPKNSCLLHRFRHGQQQLRRLRVAPCSPGHLLRGQPWRHRLRLDWRQRWAFRQGGREKEVVGYAVEI